MNDQYLAGFFDGEGSVYLARRNRSNQKGQQHYRLRVSVSQNTLPVLEMIQKRFGGHINPSGRCYQWVQGGQSARPFLEAVRSHSIVKRSQIDLALRLLEIQAEQGPNTHMELEIGRARLKQLKKSKFV